MRSLRALAVFLFRDFLILAVLVLASVAMTTLMVAAAETVFLDLGPNDAEYVRGFRADWERDGATCFHWTSLHSEVRVPVHACGDGFVLRARVRRHYVAPAHIVFRVEGRTAHAFDLSADTKTAYRIIEFPLPKMDGRYPFQLGIDSAPLNDVPLGLALDWIELRRTAGSYRYPAWILVLTGILAGAAYAIPRGAGSSRLAAALHASAVATLVAIGARVDVLATERCVRNGVPAYLLALAALALAVFWTRKRPPLAPRVVGALVTVVSLALIIRLVLVLHPRFYYPDVRVHALVAQEIASRGLTAFLDHLIATQYRLSLGLQFYRGHWYAFPYAPGFYVLSWPIIRFFHVRPEIAVSLLPAVVNALEASLAFLLAWWLLRSQRAALLAAVCHATLPLFLVRLTVAHFPSLVGHALDLCVLLFLMRRLERLRVSNGLVLSGLLAASLLMYTQSLINFGLLLTLFLGLDVAARRRVKRAHVVIAGAALLATLAASGLFYVRYARTFLDIHRGLPTAEEEILKDKQRVERSYAAARGETSPPTDDPEPYEGAGVSPLRGVRKVSTRLWIFYGPFAASALLGLIIVARGQTGSTLRFVVVWASLFAIVGFLSAALPSPNLLRHAKDLEVVAPLFCAAIAASTEVLWRRSAWIGAAHHAAFVIFGLWKAVAPWSASMFVERY